MVQLGKPPYLECSSKGEKQLSAFYARPKSLNGKSIEEAYQAMKVLPDGRTGLSVKEAKGQFAVNQDDCVRAYDRWWKEWIDENRSLRLKIIKATGLSDIFGQTGHACQAEVLWRIKRGFEQNLKVIVAGSRGFNDYKFLELKLDNFRKYKEIDNFTIISGTANGGDRLGEEYAHKRNFSLEYYPADWDKFGKSAGYKRNEQMADIADVCIVFWDGKSKGSKHMFDIAQRKGLETYLIKYNGR